jgi:CHAP domain
MRDNLVLSLLTPTALVLLAGCSAASGGEDVSASTASAVTGGSIASLALANVGKGACSTNSKGGKAFDSSCTGNGGEPEYWCADFARWVWAQQGVEDTSQLTAAAGSFYVYGQNHGTLHSTPAVGDAVVFDYQGGGVADHVALVTQVNSNGTIETVSGDWGGESGSEAHFSSTSHVVLNAPSYADKEGTTPGEMGMTISGYVAPVGGTGGSSSGGSSPAPKGCYSDTLGKQMQANACVQSKFDDLWYQCDDGSWVDRWNDPTACDGVYPL